MNDSLRTLLSNLFDYAGMFPPAGLPLAESAANFVHYRQSTEKWMLSRMVVSAKHLGAMDEWVAAQEPAIAVPLPLTVVLTGDDKADSFVSSLEPAWQQLAAMRERHPQRLLADVYELRLPATVVTDGEQAIVQLFNELALAAETYGVTPHYWFCEATDVADWEAALSHLVGAIRNTTANSRHAAAVFLFKLRTGGLEPTAVPSSERMARAIRLLAQEQQYWKATAGLHHPLRSHDASLGCLTHGFLNVLVADVLTRHTVLGQKELVAILEEQSASAFTFSDTQWQVGNPPSSSFSISWRNLHAPAPHRGLLSIGSCSFDEPRVDLAALGLL